MKVLIVTDIHIHYVDGNYYLAKQVYSIVKRYKDAFGNVTLFCRVDKTSTKEELIPSESIVSEHIVFSNLHSVMIGADRQKLKNAIIDADLVIGRFHSISACVASQIALSQNKPFFAEVMGDAFEGYWNHGSFGKLVAPIIYYWTKHSIYNSNYALYVTEHYLQNKYPCNGKYISASNVELSEVDVAVLNKRIEKVKTLNKSNVIFMTAANVDVRAKGHEYMIKAIPLLKKSGINPIYLIAGGGDKSYLERIAISEKVINDVVFLGRLSSDQIKHTLDKSDIYIQPSLQEGLPRAVIEAMSRGCICVGAKTAGIPELLSPNCVFKRKSPKDIARVVMNLFESDLEQIASDNYYHSKEYLSTVLDERRNEFLDLIKAEVE